MSYHQIILKYLKRVYSEAPDAWVFSYNLEKVHLEGSWVGSSGTRRARELAEAGKIEVRKQGIYVQYRHKPELEPKMSEQEILMFATK